MILVDVSSILHRMIFGSTKDATKIKTKDGKYITEDFIFLTIHYILSELIDIKKKYPEYGDLVLCFDDYKKAYWRRDLYPEYKAQRKTSRDSSTNPINYEEVFKYTNELFEQIRENTPWKCVYVNRAEADDIILVLAKEYSSEGVLILSPDKDFLQAQRYPNVKQYSSLTKKWIVPEDKGGDMSQWITKHILLGDASDGVPKVVDFTNFSENFNKHLESKGCKYSVKEFKELSIEEKRDLISDYDIKVYDRKGNETGFDLYESRSFGESHIEKIQNGKWKFDQNINKINSKLKELRELKKVSENKTEIQSKIKDLLKIKKELTIEDDTIEHRLEEFLDSHELYKEHYDRNFQLVMEEGIPDYIRANILMEYNSASTAYNEEAFNEYLDKNHLSNIKSKLPLVFNATETLDITNCGWEL